MVYCNQMYQLITNFFKSLPDYFTKMAGFIYLYLTPLHLNLITIYLLLFFDLITGLTKAIQAKQPITASKLTLTLSKFVFYSIALILAFQVDVTLFSSTALLLTHAVGYYITLIELKSNLENISTITKTDIWETLKDKISAIFKQKTDGK